MTWKLVNNSEIILNNFTAIIVSNEIFQCGIFECLYMQRVSAKKFDFHLFSLIKLHLNSLDIESKGQVAMPSLWRFVMDVEFRKPTLYWIRIRGLFHLRLNVITRSEVMVTEIAAEWVESRVRRNPHSSARKPAGTLATARESFHRLSKNDIRRKPLNLR